MQFYTQKPINNYSRPPRRQSKNYTTVIVQQQRDEFHSKSTRKNAAMARTYGHHEKQNAMINCKSTVNIAFPDEPKRKGEERNRSSSFMNKSQVDYRNSKPDKPLYQPANNKYKSKSRWQTTQYSQSHNYDSGMNPACHQGNQQSCIDTKYNGYNGYTKTSNNLKSYSSMNANQQFYQPYGKPTGVHFEPYREQTEVPKFKIQQQIKLDYNKQKSISKSSKNIPLYERLKAFNTTALTFKTQDQSYLSSSVSFQNTENIKTPFMNQSLGGNKYRQLYDSFDNKNTQELYSSYKSKGSLSTNNLAKSTISRNQSLKQPELDDFMVGQCKGQGRFGKVYVAIHKRTGFLCALKKIKKQSVKYMIEQFIQQVKIQMYLNHPKLVKIYGYFADKEYFYMLVQYMQQGSLYSLMKKNKKLEENEAAEKLNQICQGIKQMHDQNIVHRDLKPENVVMTNGVCKICDFGWAAICEDRRQTYCGTLDYVCPEIVSGNAYDSSADIWCIGVLAYELMCGKPPFYDISRTRTIQKIKQCKIDSFPPHLSKKAIKFIQMILKKNPDSRVGIQQLITSQFLRSAKK